VIVPRNLWPPNLPISVPPVFPLDTCHSYLTFVLSTRRPRCCQQRPNLFCHDSEIFVNPAWSMILADCYFDVALLPPWPVSYALLAMCIIFAPDLFSLCLFRFRFIIVKEDFFPAELKWVDFLGPFFWVALHDPVVHRACLLIRSSRPADWKKWGVDIAASPSILVALLIYCSACHTAHVGDLCPASSNCCVRLVSFRMVVISACSWPIHLSSFSESSSPAGDCLSSSWVHTCSQTFRRDDSRFVHSLFPYLRRVLDSVKTTCWNLLVQEPSHSCTSGISWSERTQRSWGS